MHTNVTSTRSKLKVKVTELLKFQKLPILGLCPPSFWRGAQKWWLIMITWDLVYSLSELSSISEFPSQSAITWLQTSCNVDNTGISKGHISMLLAARGTWSGMLVVLHVMCILIWPWPDPRSRSRSRGFWFSENCTFQSLSPAPVCCAAQNWWLIMVVWDQVYYLLEPDFCISPPLGGYVTSKFAKCW